MLGTSTVFLFCPRPAMPHGIGGRSLERKLLPEVLRNDAWPRSRKSHPHHRHIHTQGSVGHPFTCAMPCKFAQKARIVVGWWCPALQHRSFHDSRVVQVARAVWVSCCIDNVWVGGWCCTGIVQYSIGIVLVLRGSPRCWSSSRKSGQPKFPLGCPVCSSNLGNSGTEPRDILRSTTESCGALRSASEPCRVPRGLAEPGEAFQSPGKPRLRSAAEVCRAPRSSAARRGVLRSPPAPCGALWSPVEPCARNPRKLCGRGALWSLLPHSCA